MTKYSSNYQSRGKRAKPKSINKVFNKNGIPIVGERPAKRRYITDEGVK